MSHEQTLQPRVPRAASDALRDLLLAFEANGDASFAAFKQCWLTSRLPALLSVARRHPAVGSGKPSVQDAGLGADTGGLGGKGESGSGKRKGKTAAGVGGGGGESDKKEAPVGEAVLHTAAASFLQGFWSAARDADVSSDVGRRCLGAPADDESGGSGGAAGGGNAEGGGGGAGWRLLVRIGALYSLFCMHFCGQTPSTGHPK
ncbi:hypothetical protein T484DRAFT_1898795 [Baffinella frigidus]|nr:hypothetical protein T484DRAFT_1898795 [Cryptophyta sp. CCMP2293]